MIAALSLQVKEIENVVEQFIALGPVAYLQN